MKNLYSTILTLTVVISFGLACQNNPLSRFTQKYSCTIAGEPPPTTTQEYIKRAKKHIDAYKQNGAIEEDDCAYRALNEAIRLDPNNINALMLRSYFFWEKKEYDLALADCDKVIRLAPNYYVPYLQRSHLYEDLGKLSEALAEQTTVIDLLVEYNSTDIQKLIKEYQRRAGLFEKNNDYENAIKDYSEMIRLNPNEKNTYHLRAKLYRILGKNDLAQADELHAEKFKDTTTIPPSSNNQPTKTLPKSISGGVLNGKAVNLIKPAYPPAAKAVRESGAVNVQVTIDENGNVVSAKAVSGHPLLRPAAESAARSSKFSPTMLSGQKVKVTGVIVYNFAGEL